MKIINRFALVVLALTMFTFLGIPGLVVAKETSNIQFDSTAAEEEAYWYSRYNLGNLTMTSGMGLTFMPDMSMVQSMIKMVDTNPDDGDTAVPPMNASLLKALYASGDPSFTMKIDINDFYTQRWNPSSFDKTITSRAMGWSIIKEVEWAKMFHVDSHFGKPYEDFGAQQRFLGMILNVEAKMQAQYALQMLINSDGYIANSDGEVDFVGQWVMLEALTDLGHTLGMETLPNSETNRYYDENGSHMFAKAADMLFGLLKERIPTSEEEYSLAIQALTWYAASTSNLENKDTAINLINKFGHNLVWLDTTTATEKSFVVRGLIEAYRVTNNRAYISKAVNVFEELLEHFNYEYGYFEAQSVYTIDDIAVIIGAINSARLFAGNAIDQEKAEEVFTKFFENAVNKSGLQQSAPPVGVRKGEFEQHEPSLYYGYPTIPMPPMAGGTNGFGIAPVFATEVAFKNGEWVVTNARFDTAGAMHASNEFMWLHNDEINGFPELKDKE
ncbi:MAG: hypothetical protein ACP5EQ_06935 [Candidatus Cloacimonadia bacterium]